MVSKAKELKFLQEYKFDEIPFHGYTDGFDNRLIDLLKAYHKNIVNAVSDEDISKLGWEAKKFQPKGYVDKTIGEVVGESYVKAFKEQLLKQ